MKLLIVLLIAYCGVVLCYRPYRPHDDGQMRDSFIDWMRQHNKVYASEEFHKRWGIWRNNAKWIQLFNQQNVGFSVAMNEFGDLTNEEFNQIYKGLRLKAPIEIPANVIDVATSALPTTVDWRTKGVVTGVKNQGQCGSCWSFSTTGSMEGAHALQTGQLVGLSEQNLMDCSSSEGNDGCDGGLMTDAFQYIINNNGIDTEASYPYTAADGYCQYKAANCGSTLKAYQTVTSGSESALQEAVANIGPVSVAIDASQNSFQFYSSGVYYSASCSSTQLDHGVLAVGYGTSGSSDYWLVKNSWGASWGLSGYIWMSRNRSNNCGIATMASYPLKSGALNC